MEDALISILESLKYPVYRQGSLSEGDEYPDTFFTFWNTGSPDHAHYDNEEYGTEWSFGVYIYSIDPETAYTALASARSALKSAGWIVPSKGFDVGSDEDTHIGRGLYVIYKEF